VLRAVVYFFMKLMYIGLAQPQSCLDLECGHPVPNPMPHPYKRVRMRANIAPKEFVFVMPTRSSTGSAAVVSQYIPHHYVFFDELHRGMLESLMNDEISTRCAQ